MSTTIYTSNGKILVNGSNNKWLKAPVVVPVQVGNQIWSNKNLAIDDGGAGISTATINYGQGDVVEHYYTFDAAVRVAASVTGWHLPTKDEWQTLISYIGSSNKNKLKSTYGWSNSGSGTDDYGFSAFPAGNSTDHLYKTAANFWSSTGDSGDEEKGYLVILSSVFALYTGNKTNGYSIRLIKDS